VVNNSRLTAGKVIRVYNGRAEIENRIKEGKIPYAGTKPVDRGSRPTKPG